MLEQGRLVTIINDIMGIPMSRATHSSEPNHRYFVFGVMLTCIHIIACLKIDGQKNGPFFMVELILHEGTFTALHRLLMFQPPFTHVYVAAPLA